MDLPLGFDEARRDGQVCELKKSLYGSNNHPKDGLIGLLKQFGSRVMVRLK